MLETFVNELWGAFRNLTYVPGQTFIGLSAMELKSFPGVSKNFCVFLRTLYFSILSRLTHSLEKYLPRFEIVCFPTIYESGI